jgi:hypothetical protein
VEVEKAEVVEAALAMVVVSICCR